MGSFTVYDALIDNPCMIKYIGGKSLNLKELQWLMSVRVVLKNGKISDVGYYNGDGSVIVKKKSLLSYFCYNKYDVTDIKKQSFYDADGFIILNKTYEMLNSHKDYKEVIKNKNLFTLLKEFANSKYKNTEPLNNYTDLQYVYYDPNFLHEEAILKKDIWGFIDFDIETNEGIKNKNRIQNIINSFINFALNKCE